jgi:membrane dipeptidase
MIIDAHSDFGLLVGYCHFNNIKNVFKEERLSILENNGLNLEVLTIGGDFELFPKFDSRNPEIVSYTIAANLEEIRMNAHRVLLLRNKTDLDQLKINDKIGFIFHLEGCSTLESDGSRLDNFYSQGLRSLSLTHNERNAFADGCGVKNPNGLSSYGFELVDQINKLKMILDVSHLSEPSFWDAIESYDNSLVASHSNARNLCDHFRNLTDEQIISIANKDGVIGINSFGEFLDLSIKNFTLERFIDHIDYVVNLIGIDHVGIGPDFLDYATSPSIVRRKYPMDFYDITCIPSLKARLDKRGYSKCDIDKILGENFARIYKRVLPY